jgi:hypothetical protein
MKKLLLVLSCVVLATVLFVGCLPGLIAPGDEEPEVPVLTMEANVDAVLVEGEPNQIAWSIENIGELFIREYVVTFDVLYPMKAKNNILFDVVGNYLEIGAKHEGMLDLLPYDTPETVSVSWELFD